MLQTHKTSIPFIHQKPFT